MPVSRRRFLEVAACAVPGTLADARLAAGANLSNAELISHEKSTCTLVDLEDGCVLRESLDGFRSALDANSVAFGAANVDRIGRSSLILAPGGVLHSSRIAQRLRDLVDDGATMIYESGAAYADADDFENEHRLLARYFRIQIDAPIELWSAASQSVFAPYVHYDWPHRVMVRDFSRAIPVASGHATFARLGEVAVAERVQLGSGEFIFLGSPLGPHLRSGDREAQSLLDAFIRSGRMMKTHSCHSERSEESRK